MRELKCVQNATIVGVGGSCLPPGYFPIQKKCWWWWGVISQFLLFQAHRSSATFPWLPHSFVGFPNKVKPGISLHVLLKDLQVGWKWEIPVLCPSYVLRLPINQLIVASNTGNKIQVSSVRYKVAADTSKQGKN